jgi:hypothetical protein
MTSHVESPAFGAWIDLVFHVLSFVHTVRGDHSSLYSEDYESWCRAHHSGMINESCEEVYKCLSTIYRDSPRSYFLHAFPVLWDSISEFLNTYAIPFNRISWTSPYRARISRNICECVTEECIQTFREALRITAEAGFEDAQQRLMVSKETSYAPLLLSGIREISKYIPGIEQANWAVSLPLRTHGRLIANGTDAPWIFVGVPDTTLDIQTTYPLIQGCHEFLVWQEQIKSPASIPEDTIPGTSGYETFMGAERRALESGERLLAQEPWEIAYRQWRENNFRW